MSAADSKSKPGRNYAETRLEPGRHHPETSSNPSRHQVDNAPKPGRNQRNQAEITPKPRADKNVAAIFLKRVDRRDVSAWYQAETAQHHISSYPFLFQPGARLIFSLKQEFYIEGVDSLLESKISSHALCLL